MRLLLLCALPCVALAQARAPAVAGGSVDGTAIAPSSVSSTGAVSGTSISSTTGVVTSGTSVANQVVLTGSSANNAAIISTTGSDSSVDLTIAPKVNGKVLFTGAGGIALSGGILNATAVTTYCGSTNCIARGGVTNDTGAAKLYGQTADGASAVGTILDNTVTFANAGAKLTSFRNNTTEKAFVDLNGLGNFNGLTISGGSVTGNGTLVAGAWMAEDIGTATTGTNFTGGYSTQSLTGKFRNITCSWATAGTGGTTVVMAIQNTTDSSELCSCAITTTCSSTASVPLSCDCNTSFAAGKKYTLRYKSSSDCSTYPANTICNVEVVQ